ncbi:methyl-viologen-reducing hydrogenase subunit delta [bacterium SM23_57]|nr:MAG: methyl-viologen-reducing hydrogenase subunit delta [bacterium SM23_57]
MMDAGRHPRIKLYTYSEVDQVSGFVGNFHITIRKKARYVDETECTACQECTKVCPVAVPDEYQEGFSSRKAIYIPFAQAVPSAYILDIDNCLGNKPIACGKCAEVCEKNCIDYDMQDEYINVEVGTVIVATGMKVYDPTPLDEFGYTQLPDVITSMEFERLICAGGPTAGHFIRPSDRERPKRIGFIQCVGSRSSKRGNPYCSNICCMNTVKDTLLLRDHYPDTESTVFYMDMRSFGKGFEDLYMRSKDAGVRYVRGIPGEVRSNGNGGLVVSVENTTTNNLEEYDLDMVVLSVGVEPRRDQKVVQQLLTLSNTADGFLMESHPKLKPVDAPTQGVFFAGCVESPKDVKDSVTQAGAAAARASILLNAGRVKIEAITAMLDRSKCNYCGLCARVCPYNAIEPPIKKEEKYPNIIEAACQGCGTCSAECPTDAISMRHFSDKQMLSQVEAILEENPQGKIVVFACNWCSYAGGDDAGTARLQYPPTSRLIRTMCSGRVDPDFVLHAFRKGAPVVLVSGCHFSDCHYINAVTYTQRRIEKLWDKLEKFGIRPERLQLEWISAADGQKFAVVMKAVEEIRQTVTPEEIEYTMKVLGDQVTEKAAA